MSAPFGGGDISNLSTSYQVTNASEKNLESRHPHLEQRGEGGGRREGEGEGGGEREGQGRGGEYSKRWETLKPASESTVLSIVWDFQPQPRLCWQVLLAGRQAWSNTQRGLSCQGEFLADALNMVRRIFQDTS